MNVSKHKKSLSFVPLLDTGTGPTKEYDVPSNGRKTYGQSPDQSPRLASGQSPVVSRRKAETTPPGAVPDSQCLLPPATGASGVVSMSSSTMSRGNSVSARQSIPPSPSPILLVDNRVASVTCTSESVFINYASTEPWACVSGCLPRSLSELNPRRLSEDVPYAEILSANLYVSKGPSSSWLTHVAQGGTFEMELCTFVRSSSIGKRSLWAPRVITVSSPDREPVEQCMAEIQRHIRGLTERPKSLLVLINPYGGAKKAALVYEREVRPVFDKAGIKVLLRTTQYSGDAKDTIRRIFGPAESIESETSTNISDKREPREARRCATDQGAESVSHVDGVVAVGGDGLFHEVVAGLLEVDMGHRVRVAHVAAGSTDAVACTLNGTRSAFTAAAHVVLGDSIPLDVLRLDSGQDELLTNGLKSRDPSGSIDSLSPTVQSISPETTKFALSMASYGFFGDVMDESEKVRWLGPVRYDLVGARMWMRNKSYYARVEYLPAPQEANSRQIVCTKDCPVCSQPSHERVNPAQKSFKLHAQKSRARFESDWRTIEGEFAGIMLVIMPCRSEKSKSGVCKYSHLSDGRIHLVTIKACSRWRYLRFLLGLSKKGLESGSTDDGIVHVEPCAAIKITHLERDGKAKDDKKENVWNVDGELFRLEGGVVWGDVHRACVHAFSRGVEG